MRLRSFAIAAFGALVLGGCTPAQAPQNAPAADASGPQSIARQMSAADRSACTSSGGRVERRGRLQAELCIRPFADAGKQCTDSAQCDGKCIGTSDQSTTAAPVSGTCQADDRLFGCYSEVLGGKAVNAICVD
jgi:hypothetical protein